MSHPKTEKFIKEPIRKLLEERAFASIFIPVKENGNPREYELPAFGTKFRSDFAYKITGGKGGWLFIEDDSDKTCLSNLLKYSAWINENKPEGDVYVVHIISPKDSGWIQICRQISKEIKRFTHVMITTQDWPEEDNPPWLSELRHHLKRLAINLRRNGRI